MKKNTNVIISFIIGFSFTLSSFAYYGYIKTKEQSAIETIEQSLEELSSLGVEIGYNGLKVTKTPTQINFAVNNIDVLGIDANAFIKKAYVQLKNQKGYEIELSDITFDNTFKIDNIKITGFQKDANVFINGVNYHGFEFDNIDVLLKQDANVLEIAQLVLKGKEMSVVAQGECLFNFSNDIGCKFNTSSQGVLEFLEQGKEKELFTSRGVYVAQLVLRSQTSKRIITPIEFNKDGFYIKNILMTPEKRIKQ